MRLYGLNKNELDSLKNEIEFVFKDIEDVKAYLFGSRAIGTHKKYSDVDIFLKSKDPSLNKKIETLKNNLEESDLPYKFDISNWSEIIPEFKKDIQKKKKLLWSADSVEKSSPWRICPIGQHWVRRHDRLSKKGKIEDVDGHCRKNKSKKDVLKSDEIELIAQTQIFKDALKNPMSLVVDRKKYDDYDDIISGWVTYWNDVFKPEIPLSVEMVKILILTESTFRSNITTPNKSKKIGPARGIIQITEQTWRILKDPNGELKNHLVEIKKEELLDPNKNISAGVRWLFRKRETLKKRIKREPTWEEILLEYKGFYTRQSKLREKLENDIEYYKGCLKQND